MDEVEIVDHDPRWPVLFDEEAKRLWAVLDPSLIVGLEHFGSTAVPDLSAKPIIDILIAVRSLADAQATFVEALRLYRRQICLRRKRDAEGNEVGCPLAHGVVSLRCNDSSSIGHKADSRSQSDRRTGVRKPSRPMLPAIRLQRPNGRNACAAQRRPASA
jgi:hypothetical protein